VTNDVVLHHHVFHGDPVRPSNRGQPARILLAKAAFRPGRNAPGDGWTATTSSRARTSRRRTRSKQELIIAYKLGAKGALPCHRGARSPAAKRPLSWPRCGRPNGPPRGEPGPTGPIGPDRRGAASGPPRRLHIFSRHFPPRPSKRKSHLPVTFQRFVGPILGALTWAFYRLPMTSDSRAVSRLTSLVIMLRLLILHECAGVCANSRWTRRKLPPVMAGDGP